MQTPPLRAGLFGIGLDTYWPQFPGLKERLEGYVARVAGKLARPGVEIVNLGLVDNPERAFETGREFRRVRAEHLHGNRRFRRQKSAGGQIDKRRRTVEPVERHLVHRLAVIEEMERALPLSVPLKVDGGFGKNWLEAH